MRKLSLTVSIQRKSVPSVYTHNAAYHKTSILIAWRLFTWAMWNTQNLSCRHFKKNEYIIRTGSRIKDILAPRQYRSTLKGKIFFSCEENYFSFQTKPTFRRRSVYWKENRKSKVLSMCTSYSVTCLLSRRTLYNRDLKGDAYCNPANYTRDLKTAHGPPDNVSVRRTVHTLMSSLQMKTRMRVRTPKFCRG